MNKILRKRLEIEQKRSELLEEELLNQSKCKHRNATTTPRGSSGIAFCGLEFDDSPSGEPE